MQINDCKGKKMKLILKNGDVLFGFLAFYNYDEQVIHLEGYTLYDDKNEIKEEGRFTVINKNSWHTLSTVEED